MALNAKKVFQDLEEQKVHKAETIEVTIGDLQYDVKFFSDLDPDDMVLKKNLYLYVGEFLEDMITTELLSVFLELDPEDIAATLSLYVLTRAYTDIDFSETHGTDLLNFLAILAQSDLLSIVGQGLGKDKIERFYVVAMDTAAEMLNTMGDRLLSEAEEAK